MDKDFVLTTNGLWKYNNAIQRSERYESVGVRPVDPHSVGALGLEIIEYLWIQAGERETKWWTPSKLYQGGFFLGENWVYITRGIIEIKGKMKPNNLT